MCMLCVVLCGLALEVDAGLSTTQRDAVLNYHNNLRDAMSASDMMKMTWDDSVAAHAQTWADGCPGGTHSDSSTGRSSQYDGENMAQSASSNFELTESTDLTASVQNWYDERSAAGSYKSGGTFTGFGECTSTCGHFTQVVWASANVLGCGVASCTLSGMDGYLLVCQYHASVSGAYGGNMMGSTIFTTGDACTACPTGFTTCSSNLCASSDDVSTTDADSDVTNSTTDAADSITDADAANSGWTNSTTDADAGTTDADAGAAPVGKKIRPHLRKPPQRPPQRPPRKSTTDADAGAPDAGAAGASSEGASSGCSR